MSTAGSTNPESCSSGFAVVSGCQRYMTTAGQYDSSNGNSVNGCQSVYGSSCSVSDRWYTQQARPNFPTVDVRVVSGSSYTNRVYSATNTYSNVAITGFGNPASGTPYCQYGVFSGRVCFTMDGVQASWCDAEGCTSNLAYATEAYPVGQPGDSGGPVVRELSSGYGGRGLVVAGDQSGPVGGSTYYTIYWQRWNDVAATLGMTGLTTQ
jgi:hypothetical protein